MENIKARHSGDFEHFFDRKEDWFWRKMDRKLVCLAHQCFYSLASNLEYGVVADDSPKQTYLSLHMRNDCYGKRCCLINKHENFLSSDHKIEDAYANHVCTRYTSAQVFSKNNYGE